MNKFLMVSLLLLAFAAPRAQEGDTAQAAPAGSNLEEKVSHLEGKLESLGESFLETKATADKLAKIKLSGYVQGQWQYADSNGIGTTAGGGFPANSKQRFMVRRGRLKTTYEGTTNGVPTSRYVLQFDVIPAGVSIKDAYVTLMEPWLKTFSYTMGVFDRPFGFEISYSSSARETPERSRVFQTLFPGERDMGAKLEISPPFEMGILQYFNLKGGVFTGMGPTVNEIDNEQDIIGRAGFQAPFYDINLAIDGGFSMYMGKVLNLSDTAFAHGTDSLGRATFARTTGNLKQAFDRNIMGADLQIYYDIPVIGGASLRGEYLWGEIPCTKASTAFYRGDVLQTATKPSVANPFPADPKPFPLYTRNVMGWYFQYVQNLGNKLQGVFKYDVYDPNTDIEGDDVGKGGTSAHSNGDLMWTTIGLGGLYHWDENIRLMAYYDMVTNETAAADAPTGLAAWKADLSDNVFTFRAQVKF